MVPSESALVTGLQAGLYDVYVRPGPEQAPAVAQEGQQREDDHPNGPKGPTRSAGKPDGDAHKRCRGRDTCLLDQATAQVRLALHQSGPCRHGADGQIGAQSVEVRPRAGRIDGAETFVQLLSGQPTGDGVLVQLLDKPFALSVGYTYLTRIGHIQNVDQAGPRRANVVLWRTILFLGESRSKAAAQPQTI